MTTHTERKRPRSLTAVFLAYIDKYPDTPEGFTRFCREGGIRAWAGVVDLAIERGMSLGPSF